MAHLLVGGGTLRKGTRVDALMHDLLGRAPGTVPGEAPAEPAPSGELSPEASVTYMKSWLRARQAGSAAMRD